MLVGIVILEAQQNWLGIDIAVTEEVLNVKSINVDGL